MADLENLLLEAAGRTGSGGRNRHSLPSSRRRRDGSYSDGGSDSRDDDSDDELNYGSRKPSGIQVPLKKRLDQAERDDDMGSHEEGDDGHGRSDHEGDSSDESNIGDDLYKDDDDRRKLSEMTELQREMILSDRAAKKDDKNLLGKISSKRDKGKAVVPRKQSPPMSSSRVRASARSADRSAKNVALNELRAKRLKQQDPEAHRRLREASKGSGARRFSPQKRKTFTSASLSSSSHSESESHSDDDGSTGDGGQDSDDDRTLAGSGGLSFQDIKEITIRRSKLARWFMEPFFEELIVGCFVRVGIGRSKTGPIYRLCMVKNVDASEPDREYKLENKNTYKYLNVVWGNESSAARWQMAMVSDSPPIEEEFKQWVKEVDRSGGRLPSKHEVLDKKQAIQKITTFVYSAATVKQMLQEKKSASSRPLNVAAEKDRLRREMEIAQSKNDEAGVRRIKKRLQELEASRQAQGKDVKALRLAEMNRKNRVENFKNASELKRTSIGLKAGEAGYDPFSRRWTRSRNYYASKPGEKAAAGNNIADGVVADAGSNGTGVPLTADGLVATAAALEAAADAGKLVDTVAPVDQGTVTNELHNFELPISLTLLQKFGGAQGVQVGFMARKQKIEATVGLRVVENDGRRHALTLSVSDYKRRRGLL
ncbi:putative RNA polymerase-associated protein Rtf1 [Lupinus albus]|uniref:Putative RNA polymerase-associated protein Rtf1 n=1 Tax=Lupinus albus TaxID=3870 RepID=A0A6A4QGK8_LUPAL|nr:putative RNA polymerase-associated protein Rtf1 [Lupinus albus]